MNFLDAGLIVLFIVFLAYTRNGISFVYSLIVSCFALGGYIIGLLLAPSLTKSLGSNLQKGLVALALMCGLAVLLGLAARIPATKIRMKILVSRVASSDRLLSWPYKIFISIVALLLLSQTLIYIPILGLQFEAQGSSLFMITHKLLPSTGATGAAQKIAPNQFTDLRLKYDLRPLTYNALKNAGIFSTAATAAAPSIVKITGRDCVGVSEGSGFIAAPNLVVTNAHVLSGASSVYIRDHKGAYPATPVLINNDYDIAVLYSVYIHGRPLSLADQPATPGIKGASLGYPGNGDLLIAEGTVESQAQRSMHRKLDGSNTIALSAALGQGSSGGPVLDETGKVIGVNDAGGKGKLIAINGSLALSLVNKAKQRFVPASTDFCAVAPKFY